MSIPPKRLEPINRTYDIEEGVQARLKDPLFMLGTQWRVGEFSGADGGIPVRVEVKSRTHALTQVSKAGQSGAITVPVSVPLESEIERESENGTAVYWNPQDLNYAFSVAGGGIQLTAFAYEGDNLDWHTFSLAMNAFADTATATTAVRPSSVRYNGMPADRWYRFEDGRVNVGDLSRPHLNMLTMLLMEFSLIYARDWYHVAIPQDIGSIRKTDRVRIVDSFGIGLDAKPLTDASPMQRGCEVFTLTPVDASTRVDGSLFYLPNNLWHSYEGSPVEEVCLFRDEHVCICWAVERTVSIDGERVRRENESPAGDSAATAMPAHYWDSRSKQLIARPTEFAPGEPGGDIEGPLARYVESRVPPRYWIPFVQQLRNNRVVLRRARTYVDSSPQFLGTILGESHVIAEEQLSLLGVTVVRAHQLARDSSGNRVAWRGRKKRPAPSMQSPNMDFDVLS